MKANYITLFLCLAFGSIAFGQLEVLSTPDWSPTIDGIIDENDPWQEDGWLDQTATIGSEDHSSKFQLLHNNDLIFLAVQVSDATPYNSNTTSYENDCIHVYFHMAGESVEGSEVPYGSSTTQSRFQRDETEIANDGFFNTLITDADFEYAMVSDDLGWVLEVTFPIDVLDGGGLFDGENFMFEIETSDAVDGPRIGQAFWQNNSDDQWRYVEAFSPVHLSTEEVNQGTKYVFEESHSICAGEVYTWRGNDYSQSGTYSAVFESIDGGDSIYKLRLKVIQPYIHEDFLIICQGESFVWRGKVLTEEDVYYDSLQSVIGCDSIYKLNLENAPIPASFDVIGNDEVEAYSIFTYSVPANNTVFYTWSVQNGNVISSPSSNSAEIQWGSTGEGQVIVLAENNYGCNSDSSKLVVRIGPTSINKEQSKTTILYPNPSQDKIIIENSEKTSKYELFDFSGKLVIYGVLDDKSNEIDISGLKSGIYFFRMENYPVCKIIKQ